MVNIIYASVTGNTERVASYVAEYLLQAGLGLETMLHRAEEIDGELFNTKDIYIVATSTWDMGQMNQFLESLYEEIPDLDLTGVKMAFIGLGDLIYGEENFCKAMDMIRSRALNSGAIEIIDALKLDGDPDDQLDSAVSEWCDELIQALGHEDPQ